MKTETHDIRVEDLWREEEVEGQGELERLVYRSRLLGANRAVANYGGGNTSSKVLWTDHVGRQVEVLWVKASGSDLATITAEGFVGLRLEEVLALLEREAMTDEEMVSYLGKCQLEPGMPRPSIETLLHAFVPHRCVDHTHPDAINMICCAEHGQELARECFGEDAVWIPYMRPGFALSKLVAEAVREHPEAKLVLLAKHGLVTWGEDSRESYRRTIEAVNRAAEFVMARSGHKRVFGGLRGQVLEEERARELLVEVLPHIRGEVSVTGSKILRVDRSARVLEFVDGEESRELSQVGAACPDHLVHTKMRPLWVDYTPGEDVCQLIRRVREGIRRYRQEYEEYFRRHSSGWERMMDPNPRVILLAHVGMVTVGGDVRSAELARDLYHRAIEVMRGASGMDRFVSLTEEEAFGIEYWPLEQYKLTLLPARRELAGQVAYVTGGAGGIGSAICRLLAQEGASVVVADLDEEGGKAVAGELGQPSIGVWVDVTDEGAVAESFRRAVLEYGGVDIVVSNAGLASSAPVEETTVELWEKNHEVLAKGYFVVSREAFRLWKRQGVGGSLVYIASKNGLVSGKNASAYSSAKAAELHLARCLADEGGAYGIRVNTVNPDAVLQGSRIWSSSWREERARAYGIRPEQLEEYYRERTVLKVNIYPEDVAQAVLFFASRSRSGKSTGNILNVDGGVSAAYPR